MVQRAILIAGPTASGKSALAVSIATAFDGVVVNADSMQVYRDLDVLTARPGPADLARAPHALYGHVDGAEAYSVGRWLADVGRVLDEARRLGRLPVIVGGTGLYFKALTEGLAPVPPIPAEIRARWRAEVAARGAPALHAELAARDGQTAAHLQPGDAQRVTRALEVLEATGRGLAAWQALPGRPLIDLEGATMLVAGVPRDALWERAQARVDAMFAGGAIAEVGRLAGRGLSVELPVMRALGVAPLVRHLAGEIGLDEAAERTKGDTRHYIKRQSTWLRRNMITWKTISQQEIERIVAKDFTLICR